MASQSSATDCTFRVKEVKAVTFVSHPSADYAEVTYADGSRNSCGQNGEVTDDAELAVLKELVKSNGFTEGQKTSDSDKWETYVPYWRE